MTAAPVAATSAPESYQVLWDEGLGPLVDMSNGAADSRRDRAVDRGAIDIVTTLEAELAARGTRDEDAIDVHTILAVARPESFADPARLADPAVPLDDPAALSG